MKKIHKLLFNFSVIGIEEIDLLKLISEIPSEEGYFTEGGENMDYKHSSHSTFNLKYYLVFCTKYRYRILTDQTTACSKEIIREVCTYVLQTM
ncbi:MAG: transposase [Wolbachia sp.]|nr:transposase [Wolbachia sp.]MDD9335961.1 transposase [Wolbachia sp.]